MRRMAHASGRSWRNHGKSFIKRLIMYPWHQKHCLWCLVIVLSEYRWGKPLPGPDSGFCQKFQLKPWNHVLEILAILAGSENSLDSQCFRDSIFEYFFFLHFILSEAIVLNPFLLQQMALPLSTELHPGCRRLPKTYSLSDSSKPIPFGVVTEEWCFFETSLKIFLGKYFFTNDDRGALEAKPFVAIKKDSVQSLHSEKN